MFGRIHWPSEAGAAILLRQDKDLTVPWPLPCTPAQRRCRSRLRANASRNFTMPLRLTVPTGA